MKIRNIGCKILLTLEGRDDAFDYFLREKCALDDFKIIFIVLRVLSVLKFLYLSFPGPGLQLKSQPSM